MKQNRRNQEVGISIGMVSILVIFIVLCLTTFATLSFVSARADLKLSQKAADSVSEYYQADTKAEQVLAELMDKLQYADSDWQKEIQLSDTSFTVSVENENAVFSYIVPINEQKNLSVAVSCPLDKNGVPSLDYSILSWQVQTIAEESLQEDPVLNLISQPPL